MKIDLLDSNISADLFDECKYQEIASDESLEKILALAVTSFKETNATYKSWKDWQERASDGGYEMEIFSEDPESLFRGSILLKDKKVENALALARKYHSGQTRKGDGLEYIIHILQITRLLDKRRFGPEILAAAFCHDLLEDTECTEAEIRKHCGREVLRIVKAVSNDKDLESSEDWEKKKLKYVESVLRGGEKAITVCVADKIVNLRSLLSEYKKTGDAIWSRFNRGKEKKLWFEKKVLAMARKNWKNSLVKEYAALIRELEGRKSPRGKLKSESVFDWEITFEEGRKESFRGSASESFAYALTKSEIFAVEKVYDTSEAEETPAVRYRNLLIETIDFLTEMRQGVFGKALNLSMSGDMLEIDEAFDEGDIYDFNLEDLKGGADQNVQKLVSLLREIERTVDSLININAIVVSELVNER